MMSIIEVQNLKKNFGKTFAVDGISFSVEKGEIFGFLGPNGAGKTTTIRCLMDFIRPTEGTIKIEDKKDIGYLPGNVRLYDGWTGEDHMKFIEGIRGKSERADELINKLDFNPKIKTKTLSSGNKQKLGLILALMYDPKLLIMDEPTVGLDPLLQNKIYEILEDLKSKGTTIFMSSHNLPEVERLCSRVGIIKDGKIIALEDIGKLHAKRIHIVTVVFSGKFDKKDFDFDGVKVSEVLPDGLVIKVKDDINILIKKLSNYNLKDINISHATLEEVFLEFYARKDI